MVLGAGDRVVRRRGREEVAGDELRALVHELVERVLAVGPGRAPDDGLEDNNVRAQLCIHISFVYVLQSGSRRAGRPS